MILFTGWYYVFVRDGGIYKSANYSSNTLIVATSTEQVLSDEEFAKLTLEANTYKKEYLALEPELTPNDILTSETDYTSDEELHDYGIAIVSALRPLLSADRSNEVDTMLTALGKATTSIEKEVALLTTAGTRYRTAYDALQKLTVPPEAQKAHLDLANSIGALARLTENMSKVKTDPILAVSSANVYETESTNLLNAVHEINALFDERGITFTEEEKGTVTIYEAR